MSAVQPFVVSITATYRRPHEVAALLASLAAIPRHLGAALVIDNGAEEATRRVVENSPLPALYHRSETNLGCGGALRIGEQLALERFGPQVTHLWILDDDALVEPDTLETLLDAMAQTGAVVAHPLTEDAQGRLYWFPGLLDADKFRTVRQHLYPAVYLRRCGPEPVPFSWAPGIALLFTREALERVGLHRGDFWMRGEDLEFALRLTYGELGIYVPTARVKHLPPAVTARPEAEYLRHAAHLQNVVYLALRLRHGWRAAPTIPGNALRFIRTWGWKPRVLWEAAKAVFWGGLLGWPAGRTYGLSQMAPRAAPIAPSS